MNKSTRCKIVARVFIYGFLVIFFFAFYFLDQMSDFLKQRTTITNRLEPVDKLEPPTITICVDPPFKVSVANRFNITNQFDIFLRENSNFQSYQERFDKLSYVLNQDYQISLKIYDHMNETSPVQLTEGKAEIENKPFEVFRILAQFHGQCYSIQPNFSVKNVPFEMLFTIHPNTALDERDYPRKFYVYLTSNDSWYGIVNNNWPQYKPARVEIEPNSFNWFSIKAKELLSRNGTESTELCWKKHVPEFKCDFKCHYQSFAIHLPQSSY